MNFLSLTQLLSRPFTAPRQKVSDTISWEAERTELLGRAKWLCQQVIVSPRGLLVKMPKELGPMYGGEWAIYSLCFTAVALTNISRIYPDTKDHALPRVEQLIDRINTPEIRRYDTMKWREDAIDGIDGDNDHMTYLSLLAWVITNYKLAGGSSTRFDSLLTACCESLHRNMLRSPDLNLRSFPSMPIFLPDMLYTIVSLHNYGLLHDGRYADTLRRWMERAQTVWLNQTTGMLSATLTCDRRKNSSTIRGSYSALNCSLLALCADDAFAHSQYALLKQHFVKRTPLFGIREYLTKSPTFCLDPDAGPIVLGLSPSGTAFALGAATVLGDWEMRGRLLRTASIAGDTVTDARQGICHYRLGEWAICGEAVALGMRTMRKW